MSGVRLFAGLVGLSLALSGAAACAHVQAAQPAPSVLDVPAPPPRVVVPPSDRLMDPPEDPPAPPVTPAPTVRPPTITSRQPDKPVSAAATAPPPPADLATPQPLETTANTSGLADETTSLLNNATRDLNRVDFTALSADAKAQYTRARSFVKQAQDALHEKNLTYARNMAEKAAALASQLPKTKGLTDPDLSASVS